MSEKSWISWDQLWKSVWLWCWFTTFHVVDNTCCGHFNIGMVGRQDINNAALFKLHGPIDMAWDGTNFLVLFWLCLVPSLFYFQIQKLGWPCSWRWFSLFVQSSWFSFCLPTVFVKLWQKNSLSFYFEKKRICWMTKKIEWQKELTVQGGWFHGSPSICIGNCFFVLKYFDQQRFFDQQMFLISNCFFVLKHFDQQRLKKMPQICFFTFHFKF